MTMEIKEYLPFLIDVICIAILTGAFLYGWRQGFASRAMKLCSAILALLLAALTYNLLAQLLTKLGLTAFVASKLTTASTGAEDIAEQYIAGLKLPKLVKERVLVNNEPGVYEILGVETVCEYVTAFLSRSIVNVLSGCIMFFLSLAVLNYLAGKMKKLNKLPLVGLANQILGGVGNLLLGMVIMQLVLWFIVLLSSSAAFLEGLAKAIEESRAVFFLEQMSAMIGDMFRIR